MNDRNLKHHINWRDAWQEMRKERMGKPKVSYDNDFFNKTAEDFSKRIKLNDYEFGRKSTAILNEIVDSDCEILEIGTGPGTLTIPLSRIVNRVVGIEFSKIQINSLKTNLREANLTNVEIIDKNWEKITHDETMDVFDLVVCSHFLWQVEDVEKLLHTMENASKGFCAVIQPCGRDEIVGEIFEKMGDHKYSGQFEPDADYFAYVILREWGRLVNSRYFRYTFERDLEEQIRYVAGFIGRFLEVNAAVEKKIRDYLLKRSDSGRYIEDNNAVVMWWKPQK
jgi:SAM-dependent methyltransferase